jgi:hypothetical protein
MRILRMNQRMKRIKRKPTKGQHEKEEHQRDLPTLTTKLLKRSL